MIVSFLLKYWKQIGVAALAGLLIVGVSSLWVSLKIAKSENVKLRAELSAEKNYRKITQDNLDICVETNKQWEAQGESWTAATEQLQQESEAYKARLAAERQRRLAAIARLQDLEAEVSSQITSTDCNEAVVQFVTALGWSLP